MNDYLLGKYGIKIYQIQISENEISSQTPRLPPPPHTHCLLPTPPPPPPPTTPTPPPSGSSPVKQVCLFFTSSGVLLQVYFR